MARITNSILENGMDGAPGRAPMLDLTYGGQQGYAPLLGFLENGKMKGEWVSNKAYTRRNIIPILLEAPSFFRLFPYGDKLNAVLKSLVELHARSIEGLEAGLTVETDEHPIGGGGQVQHEFTNVTMPQSNVTMAFVEKEGCPINALMEFWIRYGLQDPETKYALAGTIEPTGGSTPETEIPPADWLADRYTMTMLFIEPDALHKKVLRSWIRANMFPLSSGTVQGSRDTTTPNELITHSIEFTGFNQYNLGTNIFAQSILDRMRLTNANPFNGRSFIDEIDPNIENATERGYKENIGTLVDNAVTNA